MKIFFTHVPTSWRHVKNICPSSAKSICYSYVCHWAVSQGSTSLAHNKRGARPPHPSLVLLVYWDMLSGLSSLSLGWLLNGKQKNSIYSWQRTGIFLHRFLPPFATHGGGYNYEIQSKVPLKHNMFKESQHQNTQLAARFHLHLWRLRMLFLPT